MQGREREKRQTQAMEVDNEMNGKDGTGGKKKFGQILPYYYIINENLIDSKL